MDEESGLVHTVQATPANEHDVTVMCELLHGEEESAYGDSGSDSDGDEVIDIKDAQPLKMFDKRFINTSDFVENISNDNIDKKEKAANKTYNSASLLDKFFPTTHIRVFILQHLPTLQVQKQLKCLLLENYSTIF